MFQPDNNTVSSSLPTPSPAGTPGYFTNGNPVTGTPATMVDADWLNMITMELINVAKKAGITPDKANYGQLAQSIEKLAGDYAVDAYTKPEADERFVTKENWLDSATVGFTMDWESVNLPSDKW